MGNFITRAIRNKICWFRCIRTIWGIIFKWFKYPNGKKRQSHQLSLKQLHPQKHFIWIPSAYHPGVPPSRKAINEVISTAIKCQFLRTRTSDTPTTSVKSFTAAAVCLVWECASASQLLQNYIPDWLKRVIVELFLTPLTEPPQWVSAVGLGINCAPTMKLLY